MNTFPVAGASAMSGNVMLFGGVLVVVLIGVLSGRSSGRPIAFRIGTAVLAVIVIGYVGLIAPKQNKVIVAPESLRISMPPYSSRTLTKADVVDAFVVDWTVQTDYMPKTRVAGTAIGDFRVGSFTLRNGRMATLLTQGTRVVVVETADRLYLLGPIDVDGFAAKMNEVFAPVRSGE